MILNTSNNNNKITNDNDNKHVITNTISNTNNTNNDNNHDNYRNGNKPRRPVRLPNYTANLRTSIMDFRGFDSSIILILRGGILMPIGNFPESLTQAMLADAMSVRRLCVPRSSTRVRRGRDIVSRSVV